MEHEILTQLIDSYERRGTGAKIVVDKKYPRYRDVLGGI